MKHEEMMCLYVYSNERRAVASDRCLAQGWFRDDERESDEDGDDDWSQGVSEERD